MSTEKKTTSDQPATTDKATEAARVQTNLEDNYAQRTIQDGKKTFRRGC